MHPEHKTLVDLEHQFWKSIVDKNADLAVSVLDEPACSVSAHGALQFDHADYRRMLEKGPVAIKSFELSEMKVLFPTQETAVVTYHVSQTVSSGDPDKDIQQEMTDSSVWVRKSGRWLCALHTETPVKEPKR